MGTIRYSYGILRHGHSRISTEILHIMSILIVGAFEASKGPATVSVMTGAGARYLTGDDDLHAYYFSTKPPPDLWCHEDDVLLFVCVIVPGQIKAVDGQLGIQPLFGF